MKEGEEYQAGKVDSVMARKEKVKERDKERIEEASTSRKVEKKWNQKQRENRKKRIEEGEELEEGKIEEVKDRQEKVKEQDQERLENADERRRNALDEVKAKGEEQKALHERRKLDKEEANNQLHDRIEKHKKKKKREEEEAAKRREEALKNIEEKEFPRPKEYDEYHRDKLAKEYPQGVTEETYKKNGKVIIRRVVVRKNKADDYHKTVTKWNTYYFKNGRSITQEQWKRETENLDL